MLKFTKLILIILVLSFQAQAEHWSYVYIQGDKETPFYVKLEDEMLPRYSKNYYIIPQLEEGPIHIQILFQQNIYPPQSFTINVPKEGNRSFLLTRKGSIFSLYDIQQKTYINPGENVVDKIPDTKTKEPIANDEHQTAETVNTTTNVANNNDPNFINNIELNNNHNVVASKNDSTTVADIQTKQTPQPTQETYNIAQEKTVNEMPAANPIPAAAPEVSQPTIKQQVESDFNKVNDTPVTTEQTPTDNTTEVTTTTPTTQEVETEAPQTPTTTEKDFSKINPETIPETTQENKIVETPTTAEQTVQESVNTVAQTEPKVESDLNKVNTATEGTTQKIPTNTNIDQQPVQETITPPAPQTEQTTPVPSSEVIKAEQEYYNAQKAKNTEQVENTAQAAPTNEQPTPQYNNTPETPVVTENSVPVIERQKTLPPPPPHPTSYYKEQEEIALSSDNKPIVNSACPEPVSEKEFDKIYNTDKSKSDGKDRLKFLMKQADENCFTTRQVYFLAKEITAESMRYSFLKKVFAHVTDQQNFRLLEDNLFKTLEWKSYFRTIQ